MSSTGQNIGAVKKYFLDVSDATNDWSVFNVCKQRCLIEKNVATLIFFPKAVLSWDRNWSMTLHKNWMNISSWRSAAHRTKHELGSGEVREARKPIANIDKTWASLSETLSSVGLKKTNCVHNEAPMLRRRTGFERFEAMMKSLIYWWKYLQRFGIVKREWKGHLLKPFRKRLCLKLGSLFPHGISPQ